MIAEVVVGDAVFGLVGAIFAGAMLGLLGWVLKQAVDLGKLTATIAEQIRTLTVQDEVLADANERNEHRIDGVVVRLDEHGHRLDEHGRRITALEGR